MIRDVPVLLPVPALARHQATFTFNKVRGEYCSLSIQVRYLRTLCVSIHYAASNDVMMVNIRKARMTAISIVA